MPTYLIDFDLLTGDKIMDKALRDIFEHGHPCKNCLTKVMCKRMHGEYDDFCNYPEQYECWVIDNQIKQIKKLEKLALKGNADAIKEIAKSTIENLKNEKKAMRKGSNFVRSILKIDV
jgi:hypothetical protein